MSEWFGAEEFLDALEGFSKEEGNGDALEQVYVGASTIAEECGVQEDDVIEVGDVLEGVGAVRRDQYESVGICYALNLRMNRELALSRWDTLVSIGETNRKARRVMERSVMDGDTPASLLDDEHDARNRSNILLVQEEQEA